MKSKELLLYLSIKYNGNFSKMLDAIKSKEKVNDEDLNALISKNKASYLTILDESYPECLKKINCPPLVLFYYGDISLLDRKESKRLAVVGSRNATEYGIKSTYDIVKGLNDNFIIVSGLAKGIDAISHKASIDSNKKTIAVLGCGIDYIYPNENKDLFKKIKKDHLLISEYPLDLAPTPTNFPTRNRIIAALGESLLVGESYEKSGTNITIYYALQSGKDIMAIPYQIGLNSYNNKLIQDGAILVESSEDVMFNFK